MLDDLRSIPKFRVDKEFFKIDIYFLSGTDDFFRIMINDISSEDY